MRRLTGSLNALRARRDTSTSFGCRPPRPPLTQTRAERIGPGSSARPRSAPGRGGRSRRSARWRAGTPPSPRAPAPGRWRTAGSGPAAAAAISGGSVTPFAGGPPERIEPVLQLVERRLQPFCASSASLRCATSRSAAPRARRSWRRDRRSARRSAPRRCPRRRPAGVDLALAARPARPERGAPAAPAARRRRLGPGASVSPPRHREGRSRPLQPAGHRQVLRRAGKPG